MSTKNDKKITIDSYRPIPFWSWNDKLEIPELVRQIEWMKEQGFGGYFMHARSGLITEYLSDDWFNCVEACLDAGDRLNMQSWAYDENGWPSGFVGGKLLEEKENHDRYLTYKIGKFDKDAFVSYLLDGEELVRVFDVIETENCLNVYMHYSTSSADILNDEVVDKFIAATHEEYKKRLKGKFKSSLKGFFTDEPQYYRWAVPFTKVIVKYFKDELGQDILDKLGLLFVKKNGYRQFRYDYYKGMQHLMLNNFAKRIYDWCNENGSELTGHFVEETSLMNNMWACAGVMPFYEYEHIPGMDHLTRGDNSPVASKQVYSVSRQLGRNKILTETFGCCGWDISPAHLKRIAEKQYVNGVNIMCQHLLPYSEHGQRKRDYPAHFSWANPWVRKDFKPFNDYFAKLGYLLGESKDNASVALFCTIRSLYFDYVRGEECEECQTVSNSYDALARKLSKMNVSYHIIDETIMAKHASVNNGVLTVGKCNYSTIVFPKILAMDKSTKELLEKFYSTGGNVLFTDGAPEYLEGQPHEYLMKTNTSIEQILSTQDYQVDKFDTEVQSTIREFEGKKFIYAVNLSDDECDITFSGNFKSFISYDLQSDSTEKVGVNVHFNGNQSHILFLSNDEVVPSNPKSELVLSGEFKVDSDSGNYLTLDKLSYSFDGVSYSPEYRYVGVFNELLNKRYNGEVYLKYSFNVKGIPKNIFFLAEDMNILSCTINGVPFVLSGESDFEKKIYKTDISKLVKLGLNEVVIKINFYESDHVYYVLFGDDVQEGLRNCLVYDTTIESCYLQGDFGVYTDGGFTEGKDKNILFADNFYIDKKKDIILDTIKDGYPFFAGDITLEKSFISDGEPCVLNLKGNYCLAELILNGKKVEKNYFDNKVDITDYVKKGENVVKITLWTGNRNLLGPHHYNELEEPLFVGPEQYESTGTWKNGKSSIERDNYSFKKFGLFE